jgi:hypothetical protein
MLEGIFALLAFILRATAAHYAQVTASQMKKLNEQFEKLFKRLG